MGLYFPRRGRTMRRYSSVKGSKSDDDDDDDGSYEGSPLLPLLAPRPCSADTLIDVLPFVVVGEEEDKGPGLSRFLPAVE